MNECIYNYSLEDNLKATKQLLKQKYKRKTSIVSGLVVLLGVIGIITSIGLLISNNGKWYIGLISAGLLAMYFAVDKIAIKKQLITQKEFYLANLNKVTKVKVTINEEKTITETFYVKEKEIGVNTYYYKDLTAIKFEGENIFLIYNNENVVMVKKPCLTEKNLLEFIKLKEKFINLKKNVKSKKK